MPHYDEKDTVAHIILVWYCVLSLCYVHIQHSGIIVTPWAILVPNLVSVTASIAEPAQLASGEIAHSITHSLNITQLISFAANQSFRFRK